MPLKSLCILFVNNLLAFLSVSQFLLDLKYFGVFVQLSVIPTLLVLAMFVLFSGAMDVSVACT